MKWREQRILLSVSSCSILTLRRRVEIEPYYEHQNDTGRTPDRQVNAVGLVVQRLLPIAMRPFGDWRLSSIKGVIHFVGALACQLHNFSPSRAT